MIHHTTKFDGSLHYRFPTEVVARTDAALAVYRGVDVGMNTYRGDFDSDTHVLQFFFSDAHHNVAVIWERDWQPKMHYVNIATPARWDDHRVSAIDLDLDIIIPADGGSVFVDDEDEFAAHIERFAYPTDLIDRCRAETRRLELIMSQRRGIFDSAVFAWRPGAPLDDRYLFSA
jgi:uncharacterized protein